MVKFKIQSSLDNVDWCDWEGHKFGMSREDALCFAELFQGAYPWAFFRVVWFR